MDSVCLGSPAQTPFAMLNVVFELEPKSFVLSACVKISWKKTSFWCANLIADIKLNQKNSHTRLCEYLFDLFDIAFEILPSFFCFVCYGHCCQQHPCLVPPPP